MKSAFLFLLIGAVLGAAGWHYYQRTQNPTLGQRAAMLADRTKEAVHNTKVAAADKAGDWKLTPKAIEDELTRTGQVVRSQARVVGERIGDARIITVIKGKYMVDDNLSTLAISVDCQDGTVQLSGSATSSENIGRAIKLALETKGVQNVVSHLVIKD